MRQVRLAACMVLILGGFVSAQEKYTVKLAEPVKGNQSSTDFTMRIRFAVEKRDLAGQPAGEDLQVFAAEFCSDITFLEGDAKTRRYSQHYRKFRTVANGETRPDAVEGKTFLVLERDGKKEMLTTKGEPLAAEERAKLEKATSQMASQPTSPSDLGPPRPVSVGETWTVEDAASWVKRDDVEAAITRATGRLLKVYRKDGRLFGVIENRVEATVKSVTVQGRKMALKPGSNIVTKSVLEGCIDGTSAARTETFTLYGSMVLKSNTPDGLEAAVDQSWEMNATRVVR